MNAAPASPATPVLDMRGVAVNSLRNPDVVMVDEVNWTVAPGDFWVVGGLHGSGKSDLLMTAAGLLAPARGAYLFFGQEMPIFDEARLGERLRLGFVFDSGQLFNRLTVAENVALPLRYHRNLTRSEAESEVQQMLQWTELAPWADSMPGTMARNWQKRAGLARALMLRPEVLLLDNPLGGLDPRHRAWWLNFLAQLSKGHARMKGRPLTLVAASSDLRPWRGRARQFAVLKSGRLIILGTWEQLEAAGDELANELAAGWQSV